MAIRWGDPNSAPRCGAKTRRGTACQSPAMANGRCRMHGGVPVPGRGPPKGWRGRTVRAGNMGFILPRSAQKRARELLTQSRELLKQMQAG
jgi:hypothetical protein